MEPAPVIAPLVEGDPRTVITSSVWRLWFQSVVDALNPKTTTVTPAAGGAGALPATPAGYVTVTINGTPRQVPYY